MAEGVCFVDTETTGLDPDRHEIWEVGLITPEGKEWLWHLPADLGRADPMALRIGGYFKRRGKVGVQVSDLRTFAMEFSRLTNGLHLVGACVSFDEKRLEKLLRANGQCPMWHYHLIDVEALAVGYCRAFAKALALAGDITLWGSAVDARELVAVPPWKSDELSRALGVNPADFDRHTALGDARWAKAIYEKAMA